MENLIFLAVRIKSFTIELDILKKIIESNIGEYNCKAIFFNFSFRLNFGQSGHLINSKEVENNLRNQNNKISPH